MIISALYCLLSSKHLRNADLVLILTTSSLTLLSILTIEQLIKKKKRKRETTPWFPVSTPPLQYSHRHTVPGIGSYCEQKLLISEIQTKVDKFAKLKN